jgi:hypothetical protein
MHIYKYKCEKKLLEFFLHNKLAQSCHYAAHGCVCVCARVVDEAEKIFLLLTFILSKKSAQQWLPLVICFSPRAKLRGVRKLQQDFLINLRSLSREHFHISLDFISAKSSD